MSSLVNQLLCRLAISLEAALDGGAQRAAETGASEFVVVGCRFRSEGGSGAPASRDVQLLSYWVRGKVESSREPLFLSLSTDDTRVSGRSVKQKPFWRRLAELLGGPYPRLLGVEMPLLGPDSRDFRSRGGGLLKQRVRVRKMLVFAYPHPLPRRSRSGFGHTRTPRPPDFSSHF